MVSALVLASKTGPLPTLSFNDDEQPEANRLPVWRERLRRLCELDPRESLDDDCAAYDVATPAFHMEISAWHLGGLVVTRAQYGCGRQKRTERHFRSDHLDHYRLTLVTEGTVHLGGPEAFDVRPGQLLLADMAQKGHASHSAGGCLSLFLPRESLDELLTRPADLHGQVLSGVLSGLLGHHMRGMLEVLPHLSTVQARDLVQPTLRLIAAAVEAEPGIRASASGEVTLLRQASRFIEMHLQDDELSPTRVAEAMGISRATLYRLFEPVGGVAAFIKERRLVLIHEALQERGSSQSVARLAEGHGFKSAAHCSEAFLRHFGYRPSEVRSRSGRSEVAAEPVLAGSKTSDPASLFQWLQQLR